MINGIPCGFAQTGIDRIYAHLGDDLSKELFGYRMLFSETSDARWIQKLLLTMPEGKDFVKKLQSESSNEKVIFGAGAWGRELASVFPIGWTCFVDNYKKEKEWNGIPIISFDEYLKKHRDATIVLTSRLHFGSMIDMLVSAGIDEGRIINMGKLVDEMSKKQYFDLPYLPHNIDEIFVDCGCLDGASSQQFIKWCDNNYKSIFAFEPDPQQTDLCRKNLKIDRCEVFEYTD